MATINPDTRVAILARRLYPPGGGERSLLYLKRRLDTECQVKVFGYYTDPDYQYDDAVLTAYPNSPLSAYAKPLADVHEDVLLATRLRDELLAFDPDLIFSQHQVSYLGAWVARNTDARLVHFLRDEEQIPDRRDTYRSFPLSVLAWAYDHALKYTTDRLFRASDFVVANSAYIAGQYTSHYPSISPTVVYPFVDLDGYAVEPGEKILHVNPSRHKGIDVTLDVAERLTDKQFIVVGTDPDADIRDRMRRLDNLEFRGYVNDMADIYRETKLILYPSRWDEPFGRVPIEAGASGIPTLCSGTGGLPESVGHDEFVVKSNDPGDYVSRISDIVRDYKMYSALARENASEKSASSQYELLLSNVPPREP